MAPTVAVSELLKQTGLALQDFDYYEIHEAFAAQVLATLKAWESEDYCRQRLGRSQALGSIDRAKLNVKGSSIAFGHPFAATGARILAVLAKLLHSQGGRRGLISICTAGGMGVAAVLEGVGRQVRRKGRISRSLRQRARTQRATGANSGLRQGFVGDRGQED